MERVGSPLYAYDLEEVERRIDELRTCLPADTTLYYSLKANPHPALVATVAGSGVGAEVSSLGELETALGVGVPTGQILYTGPGKSDREIKAAITKGVVLFSCESAHEFDKLAWSARASGRRIRLLLRLNPIVRTIRRLNMSGPASQFGLDAEQILPLLCRAEHATASLEILGVHVYSGTQILTSEALIENFVAIHDAVRELSKAASMEFRVIDFGGGFPWPFATNGRAPDLSALRAPLAAAFGGSPSGENCWFEAGRYIAASCGTLLTRVVDVKRSGRRTFVIVDAGINHLGGMSGLGRIHAHRLDFHLLDSPDHRRECLPKLHVDVVGPLCTPLDCLARDWETVPLQPGDLLAVPNVGAYGATASLVAFLSRMPAYEVAYRGNTEIGVFQLRHGHERVET